MLFFKVGKFTENHRQLSIILIIAILIIGTYLVLDTNSSPFTMKINNRIFALFHKNEVNDQKDNTLPANIIQGKVTEIEDDIATIETDDSYFKVKLDRQLTIVSASSNDKNQINDPIKVGDNLTIRLSGSKYSVPEPYEVSSISINR